MDTNTNLDTSWIAEEEKLMQIHHNCMPESLPSISLEFLYINASSSLEKIERAKYVSLGKDSSISKEQLISIIQSHKKETSLTQYVFKELSLFHIPIQPELIPSFIQPSFSCKSFFHTYSSIENIVLPPSIFIFHSSCTLVFLFCEQEKLAVKQLKSALKPESSFGPGKKRRLTKRVRIRTGGTTRHAR